MPVLVTDRCASCGGAAHPATGHAWSAATLVCGPCIRAFMAWLRNRPGPSGGKLKPRALPPQASPPPPRADG
jgi:hypothetical protein